ncbi:hypothetical protein BC829DRAFT_494094 [Chytridium lagenaria]|nr:hypothetical protein BC829DRAFT_494094 [Chytridium lagenaria]
MEKPAPPPYSTCKSQEPTTGPSAAELELPNPPPTAYPTSSATPRITEPPHTQIKTSSNQRQVPPPQDQPRVIYIQYPSDDPFWSTHGPQQPQQPQQPHPRAKFFSKENLKSILTSCTSIKTPTSGWLTKDGTVTKQPSLLTTTTNTPPSKMQIIAILVASLAAFVSAQDAEVSSSITFSTTTTAAIDDVATIDIPATLPVASSTVLASTMTTTTTAAAALTPLLLSMALNTDARMRLTPNLAVTTPAASLCVPVLLSVPPSARWRQVFGVDQCRLTASPPASPSPTRPCKKTTTQLIYSGAHQRQGVGAAPLPLSLPLPSSKPSPSSEPGVVVAGLHSQSTLVKDLLVGSSGGVCGLGGWSALVRDGLDGTGGDDGGHGTLEKEGIFDDMLRGWVETLVFLQ